MMGKDVHTNANQRQAGVADKVHWGKGGNFVMKNGFLHLKDTVLNLCPIALKYTKKNDNLEQIDKFTVRVGNLTSQLAKQAH